MIHLERFTPEHNPPAFRGYLRVKYEVFVEEQGWPLAADRQTQLTNEDDVDPQSCFILAEADGREVGTVRGTLLNTAFPHRDMLEHHLQRSGIEIALSQLATINSLAVLPALRGQRLAVSNRPRTAHRRQGRDVRDGRLVPGTGALALIFTTIRGVPAIFFEHLGGYVVDPFFRTQSIALELLNMVLMTTDPERYAETGSPLLATCPRRALTPHEQASRDYCRRRHAEITHGRSIGSSWPAPERRVLGRRVRKSGSAARPIVGAISVGLPTRLPFSVKNSPPFRLSSGTSGTGWQSAARGRWSNGGRRRSTAVSWPFLSCSLPRPVRACTLPRSVDISTERVSAR